MQKHKNLQNLQYPYSDNIQAHRGHIKSHIFQV